MRNFGVERAIEIAEHTASRAAPLRGRLLAGRRRGRLPARALREAYRIAAAAGLGCTVHAGEWAGADSVRGALELPVTRIAHGVRAIEDPALVQELARRQITLEVCPTSNVVLGVFPSFAEHPFPVLREAGIPLTLGSDDPPYFGASVAGEYAIAREHFGLSDDELVGVTRTAIEASFAEPALRDHLLTRWRTRTARRCSCRNWPAPGGPALARSTRRSSAPQSISGDPDRPHPGRRQLCRGRLWQQRQQHDVEQRRRSVDVDRREARGKKIKVGLVTDIGGLNDRSFNAAGQQGPRGREVQARHRGPRADLEVQRRLHAEPEHPGPAEVRPRHRRRVPHGRRHGEGRQEVPRCEVRDHRLVRGGDEEQAQERRGPAVRGAGGRLSRRLPVRAVRQGQQRDHDRQRRRAEDPAGRPLHRGLPGRAKAANPSIKTLNGYSQDFVDQAKCKEIALDQISKGSKVEFQVAGQCGLGVLDAAKEKSLQGIGVDADQAYLGPQVFTRAEEGRRGRLQRDQGRQEDKYRAARTRSSTSSRAASGYGRPTRSPRSTPIRSRPSRTRSPPARSSDIPDKVK